MSKKKSDLDDKDSQQSALEQRVDAIMNGEAPTTEASTETAPQLPPQLLKTIGAKTAKAKADKVEPPSDVAVVINDSDNDTDNKIEPVAIAEKDPLEDTETDKAVDDITAQEADLQLAVDDARARRRTAESEARNRQGLFSAIFTSPWTWLIIIGTAGVAYAWYH